MTDQQPLSEAIYTPESQLKHPGRLINNMWNDLKASRGLAWRFFVRDISARYRQTFLGYLWAFIPPVFTTLIFVFLTGKKLLNIDDTGIPYPVYVMLGTILWYVFFEGVNSPIKIISGSKPMLTKINFPRESLIIAALGEVIFNFIVRVLLIILILIWFKVPISTMIFLAPLGVLSLMLLGLMFGLLLTPLALLYRDIEKGLPIILQIWFFLTPVIYPVPESGAGAILNYVNPVTPVLNTCREMLTTGVITRPGLFVLISSLTLILLVLGWVLYRLAMPHLIARIGA
ncbi:MAG: ABC transporter permease [Candidatus Aminicenantes bacterium]|nr:ABC transporter permease [Candidatus Aminicenantes bacterium]